jgi:hypothetical protein
LNIESLVFAYAYSREELKTLARESNLESQSFEDEDSDQFEVEREKDENIGCY